MSFVLVRWLEPHPRVWERNVERRPVCPGQLHINNCLWSYAKTSRPRRSLVSPSGDPSRAFNTNKLLFGTTPTEQRLCWERETHAYYGLVTPDNVIGIMNLCTTFKPNSAEPRYGEWLQTVRMR